MQRALFLAQKGRFSTSPNPRVGAVIVYNNQIIGEGYHQSFGGPHAEPNAINSVKNKELLSKSCMYVTLEPCSHHGKTPPCADLIIAHQIPEVYIASKDPFEKVDGSGIELLKAAGVKVTVGLLEKEAIELNKRFFCFHQNKRPYVILKWAETLDGFIGRSIEDQHLDSWITSPTSKQVVHLWRAEEDGIMIGTNTALVDNAELSCREVDGNHPVRILIDQELMVPSTNKIFNDKAPTIVFNELKNEVHNNLEFIQLNFDNPQFLIKQILTKLHQKGILSLIVEGGTQTLQHFIDSGLWDEARVFTGQKTFKKGIYSPKLSAKLIRKLEISGDLLKYYQNT